MPFKKIDKKDPRYKDWLKGQCMHPNHNPPMHIYLKPGIYNWECPACYEVISFEVPNIRC